MRCPQCPLAEVVPCLGETEQFAYMCTFAANGNPVQRQHVIDRSTIANMAPAPGIVAKAASFLVAAAKHVASGLREATPEQQAQRLAICYACDRHVNGQCMACGCGDKGLSLKAKWAEQRCPLTPPRWGPVAPAEPVAPNGQSPAGTELAGPDPA